MEEPRVYKVEPNPDNLIVSRFCDTEKRERKDGICNIKSSISPEIINPILCGWCGFSTPFLATLFMHQLLVCTVPGSKSSKNRKIKRILPINNNVQPNRENLKVITSAKLSINENTKIRKTDAQRSKEYRERQKLKNARNKKIPKTNAQRNKEYRERQKLKKLSDKKIKPKTNAQRNKEFRIREKLKQDVDKNKIMNVKEQFLSQNKNSSENDYSYFNSFYR